MKQKYEDSIHPFITMMDRISDIVFILEVLPGPEFIYEFINEQGKQVLGLNETILGKGFEDIYPQGRADYIKNQYIKVLTTKNHTHFELTGEDGWIGETTLNPIINADDEVTHILSITRDITERKALESDLAKTSAELGLVWDHASDAIFFMNEDGSIYRVNRAFEDMLGYREEEVQGVLIPPFFTAHNQEKHDAFLSKLFGGSSFENMERQRMCKDSRIIEVLASYRPVQLNGRAYAIVMYKEVTQLKKAERQAKEREERFKSLFDANPDIIWAINSHGQVEDVNAAALDILGFTREEILNMEDHLLSNHTDSQINYEDALKKTLGGESVEYTASLTHKTGKKVELKIKTLPISVNGETIGIYEVGQDVTLRNRAQRALKKMAFSDSLTGLPNRRYITEKIDDTITAAKKNQTKFALLYIDMDHFKEINDTLGHDAGDDLLKLFANRIRHELSDEEMVARLGGDEFLVLLPGACEDGAVQKAEQVLNSLRKPYRISGQELDVTSSIGISIYPLHGKNKRELIKEADEALYSAKDNGKNMFKLPGE
ncbi:sensor domain-containing protein [Jeotgalibacillus terrae]|uniref:Diguanylate cyclase domain-containing protein n=1 Tax=Jeotgalibacillus terrae TaxID=587735 RepID=A0ABW5ZE32_9BACL|nr:diguanylate cyclase [Jeotgalibacillus terrae]MBM7579203.1 diguanylate cyclase (GGDEF)-like protein/PAS domain S-box-containing protein [Jeotgalibacillus terrae]